MDEFAFLEEDSSLHSHMKTPEQLPTTQLVTQEPSQDVSAVYTNHDASVDIALVGSKELGKQQAYKRQRHGSKAHKLGLNIGIQASEGQKFDKQLGLNQSGKISIQNQIDQELEDELIEFHDNQDTNFKNNKINIRI